MTELKRWTRHTPWRQGKVLPVDAAHQLGLARDFEGERLCVVVISHDCDLANENLAAEPFVELIPGKIVDAVNGNYAWGKSPRTLHCTASRGGDQVFIELVNTDKCLVAKDDLAPFNPDPAYSMDVKQLATLRDWLACRYNRAAFPDGFVGRMKGTKAEAKLARLLEKHGSLISFIYFDLDRGELVERATGDPYELSVVLVFPPGEDPVSTADQVESVAVELEGVLRVCFKDEGMIRLRACMGISEDELTVSQARVLMQWRLEYMSLRADEDQLGAPVF